MAPAPRDQTETFSDAAWSDVISAVDRTYSELVAYQERLEAQNNELDDLRRFMASVLSSVSDVLLVVDRNHMIERTGGSVVQVLGEDHPARIGALVDDMVVPEQREKLRQVIDDVIMRRKATTLEIEVATDSGPTPLELSVGPRLDERGRSRGSVLVGRPVGELRSAYSDLETSHIALKEAQSHLVRNEKLASLGRLVAGVAHELNNPISFVYANTHALEKYTQRFETYFEAVQSGADRATLVGLRQELHLDRTLKNLRSAIDGAKDGAERVRDIVEDLRRLSADGSGEVVSFDLMTTARTAADWVIRGTKTPVKVTFDAQTQRPAMGNPGHVQQIVMNLVQNAVDALEDTGAPSIHLRIFERDNAIVLHLLDNGPGVPEAAAHSVFDPFFTTKSVGKGTGLGLSISHKIAEEHGGSLTLFETGPEGTCFELRLPAEGEA
ncbi:ATP-binding protein [uncultured Tateyamaria sp.]|uniref:sensor histidine kinase n=1 Tax=uncultured Tateyamaria sp. TaxID=455651 RepID=UPI00261C24AC|nr:ATP-binding protein [uncultured Tateyamaria sp.]